nr:phage head closure protein [uncultured Cellulosilyticum sp.]
MDIGKLNKRITIERQSEVEDEYGVSKISWVPLKTVWCSINGLYGREYWEAKKYEAENTLSISIRYASCADITTKDRVNFNGKLFNIQHIDNIQFRNEVLKLKVSEVID